MQALTLQQDKDHLSQSVCYLRNDLQQATSTATSAQRAKTALEAEQTDLKEQLASEHSLRLCAEEGMVAAVGRESAWAAQVCAVTSSCLWRVSQPLAQHVLLWHADG